MYFEELEEGVIYAHRPGRTVTETDNVLFTTLTMNTQALHLDAAWSATQPFGQRLMNSMFTLSTMVGQSVTQLTQGTIIAQLGLTDVSFPHPLYHGDTLYTETVITGKRVSSSRPGQGVVTMKHTGRNQDGTVVALATRTCLMWTRSARIWSAQQGTINHMTVHHGPRSACSAPPTGRSGSKRPPSVPTPSSSTSRTPSRPRTRSAPGRAILAQLGSGGRPPNSTPAARSSGSIQWAPPDFEKDLHCSPHPLPHRHAGQGRERGTAPGA